jgi:alpha-D-xyloside xylohydrolase
MDRRQFLSRSAGAAILGNLPSLGAPDGAADELPDERPDASWTAAEPEQIYPGVWKFTFGTPERATPVSTRRHGPATEALAALSAVGASAPVTPTGSGSNRGYLARLPLAPNEMVYGLGLQFQSFIQRGLKKKLRVNADPILDSGDSHAPVPFYVTTRGYGVLIDTARYATFYLGNKRRVGDAAPPAAASGTEITKDALPAAYGRYRFGEPSEVLVEIPEASGVDVYVFGGPAMREAVQRYNLFSGGGPIPPRWGLGVWYRCERDFGAADVLRLAAEFRERRMPCDVLGLEPGWQTHSYSCSYVWSDKFADARTMLSSLAASHFRVNLWEHAFVHPTSPIHQPLRALSGDYEVWDGLVPDFNVPEARRIYADFHEREHVSLGVSGYKLDECDNSDFTRNWSFPELSKFPSGTDGEQYHCLFGLRYQDAIDSVFEKKGVRTYGLVRSSHALAAPYPYVLYSDLYEHATFIKAVAKAGFSGLLWTPEVRDAQSTEDLVRRLQAAALSPMALINAWYIRNPPWKQTNREANNAGRFDPEWERVETLCRGVLELRMKLVPYLHAAFVRYNRTGVPPFRPLVMDYPDDARTWTVDDQYLVGESLLVAPLVVGQHQRDVYLPKGEWFDFWSGERRSGGEKFSMSAPLEQIPIFVKSGSLLPLADVTLHTDDPASGALTVMVYGKSDATLTLYEEGGEQKPALSELQLSWSASRRAGSVRRVGPVRAPNYRVRQWKEVG